MPNNNLATEVARLKRQLAQTRKGQRLSHGASIENAAIEVRDDNGSLRAIVGQQGDGTTGVTVVNGPPPPQPSTPIVVSVIGGVTASWDGQFTGGAVMPLDWSRIEVHASTAADYVPDSVTLQSTIETPQGATVVIACETNVYVRFVARSTSGTASTPSSIVGPVGPAPVVAGDLLDGIVTTVKLADDAVTAAKLAAQAVDSTALADGAVLSEKLHDAAVSVGKIANNAVTGPAIAADAVTAGKIAADAVTAREIAAGAVTAAEVAAGAITTDKLTVTGGTNILADPSFEGPATAALVAGDPYWSVDSTKGNGSAKSLKVNATAGSATNRQLTIASFPVIPGDQLYLAIDYQASTDYNGTRARFYARFHDAANNILGYVTADSGTPVLGPTWQRISITGAALAAATRADIVALAFTASAGTLWFDNAVVRAVIGGTEIQSGAITTSKIVAGAIQTLQLDSEAVNASKIAAGAVTTAKLDALAVTADKIAANTITAGKLAAGSVDAVALKADAITGKTITGGTITGTTVTGSVVQTGTSGTRLKMGPDAGGTGIPGLALYSGAAAETSPGILWSTVVTVGSTVQPMAVLQAPYVNAGSARLDLTSPADSNVGQFRIDTNSTRGYTYISGKGGASSGTSQIELFSQNGDSGPSSVIQIKGTQIYLRSADVTVDGILTAGNMAFGQVSVTPSAPYTPTSATVFYNVKGTTFFGQATANTTVPGYRASATPSAAGVTGVSVSSVTATSMMVWVNRENTTATNVNWLVTSA